MDRELGGSLIKKAWTCAEDAGTSVIRGKFCVSLVFFGLGYFCFLSPLANYLVIVNIDNYVLYIYGYLLYCTMQSTVRCSGGELKDDYALILP